MSTVDPTSKKTFITMTNESVTIFCKRKKYEFSNDSIEKIAISKRKPGAIFAMIGNLLDYREMDYYLTIRTNDDAITRIPINRVQRYFCIKLIAALRLPKSHVPDFV